MLDSTKRRAPGRPFVQGNPGRRPGSKNRSTVIASALLQEEAPELVRRAIQLALGGNVVMLKFLLSQLLPRDRLVKFELPEMRFADDGVEALGEIARAAADGVVTPAEGANLATILQAYTAAIETHDVVKRLDTIEAQLKGLR